VNPGVGTVISYIGNWDDVSAGKEQAIALISRNIDIIFQNADAAGLGTHDISSILAAAAEWSNA